MWNENCVFLSMIIIFCMSSNGNNVMMMNNTFERLSK